MPIINRIKKFFCIVQTTDETAPAGEVPAAVAEKQPLLPVFGEAQPTQYQRADREYDDDQQRDLENQRYKYVIGQQCMIFIDNDHFIFSLSLDDLFSVSLQEKLGDGIVEPRSLEDEGIFVGKKPVVPSNLIHRAEKRILQECVTPNKVIIENQILQRRFS